MFVNGKGGDDDNTELVDNGDDGNCIGVVGGGTGNGGNPEREEDKELEEV